jgi:hypothetical protein
MSPASEFEDLGTTFEEDFFGIVRGAPDPDNEEQLIKDGNNQILKAVESKKKTREYSRSQTSRDKTTSAMNMSFVDWSGFPAAAHSNSPATTSERKDRRASLSSAPNPARELERRATLRSQRKSQTKTTFAPEPMPAKSVSPPREDGQKYRSRRYSFKGGDPPKNPQDGIPAPPASATRRASLGPGSSHRRPERQHRTQGPVSAKRGTRANPSSRPTSPSGRIRRPVFAAASSTTLDVRRNTPQRTASQGRKQRSHRNSNLDGGQLGGQNDALLQKASSIKW